MIKILDHTNKVRIESDSDSYMESIIYKAQLIRISYNVEDDYLILYFSNDRLIISYIYMNPVQRQELNINSNIDLLNYFQSIT